MNIGSANSEPANHEPANHEPENRESANRGPDNAGFDASGSTLVTYDFAEAFAEGDENAKHKAVFAFQELLIDESACCARVAFLRQLHQRMGQLRGAGYKIPSKERCVRRLEECVERIVEQGTFVALRNGTLKHEDLVELSLDPEYLWKAHRKVCMLDDPQQADSDDDSSLV